MRSEYETFASGFVEDAGRILMDLRGRAASRVKDGFDLVTEADFCIEEEFIQRLKKKFPDHDYLAEESGGNTRGSLGEWCWVLDPLDGTVNFANGLPGFCVSLALLHRGDPVLGLVLDPCGCEFFKAVAGGAATLNGQELAVLDVANQAGKPLGISTGLIESEVFKASRVTREFGKSRIFGSQALHLCYVAAGRLRAALNPEAKLWDDAAGALIVHQVGGQYGTLAGDPVFPIGGSSSLLQGLPVRSLAATPSDFHEIADCLSGESSKMRGRIVP